MSQLGIVQEISVCKVQHTSNQLRKSLEHIEVLADSIKQYGLLQPIVVRPKLHRYEVVAGNRRLAAIRLLRMKSVTCHVVELSDKEACEIAIVENIQHKTMNPIEEAIAFRGYVETHGWGGVSELAKRIGKSQEFVTKRIQLLLLPEKIQQEIIRQRITPTVALEMLPLGTEQIEEFAELVVGNHLTKGEVRHIVKTSKNGIDHSLPNAYDLNPSPVKYTNEVYLIDKALRKSITIMKSTLVNFDDLVDNVGDDWIIKELLMQYRLIIHGDIDTFLKLRRRLGTRMPKEYFSLKRDETGKAKHSLNNAVDDDAGIHLWATGGIWQ